MESSTLAAVRDIFVIVASGVLAAVGVAVIVLVVRLFRPLQETVENAVVASRNLRKLSGDVAAVSEETAGNVAETSRNAVTITENLKESSGDVSETVRSAGDAARNVADAASKVSAIADTVSRVTSMGVGGSASGAGPLFRILRNVFGGGGRRGDGTGAKQGA